MKVEYKQTIIYEIRCKDDEIEGKYYDFTTNFMKRMYYHKQQTKCNISPLYQQIRDNGGWDNWEMVIHETMNFASKQEATEYMCKYTTTIHTKQVAPLFVCDLCEFSCSRKYDYDRHCVSNKHTDLASHKQAIVSLQQEPVVPSFIQDILKSNQEIVKSNQELVKSNQELQQQVVELSNKQPIQQITNIQNTQNNSFNVQVFLNEQCGEAFNLSDVLKSMVITNEDLVYNTQVGFVKGMTAIIKREMCDKIPLVKRPVHCTDIKRETVFFRENNKWHKEEGKTVEEDIMFQLTRSCLRTYLEWRKVHPDAEDMRSEFNTLCDKIQVSVMPGYEKDKLYPKTMTEIYKHCLIDKKNAGNCR